MNSMKVKFSSTEWKKLAENEPSEMKASELYRQYRTEGKTPEQAALDVIDVITGGMHVGLAQSSLQDVIKKYIEKWEPTVKQALATAGFTKKAQEIAVPQDVQDVARQYGWTVTVQKSGVIEFKHPRKNTPFYLISTTPSAWQNAKDEMQNHVARVTNMDLAEELARTAEIDTGVWNNMFNYQWRHNIVKVQGVVIGRIQERRGSRKDVSTCTDSSCVRGYDVRWLVAQALGKGLIKVPGAMATIS
jgi:hypothetical protein